MWGRSSKGTNCKLTWRSLPQHVAQHRRPNMLKNRTDIGTREGWPNLWFNQTNSDSSQFPLLPLQTMVCANTLLLLPKFLSLNEFMLITKNKTQRTLPITLRTPCTSTNKLAYSLFLAFFLLLVNNYFHRDPTLSRWLNNVIWLDEQNHALLAKYLQFLLKKSSIACLLKLI